ncbi:hypothetical protein LJC56_05025 [Christensenellaceae bacterium OttesenSCG-928-K19]|nr:hypothetical protein [Christensenellaceae bacterium OttesenSCG-928-K19]
MTETITVKRKDLTVDADAEQEALRSNILSCVTLHIELGETNNDKIMLVLEANHASQIHKAKQCIKELGFSLY